MTRLVKLTVRLRAGHSAGIRRLRPDGETGLRSRNGLRSYERRRKPGKAAIPAVNSPFIRDRSIPACIDSVTGGNAYRAELYFVGTREYTAIYADSPREIVAG